MGFLYFCKDCGAQAKKPPCATTKDRNSSLGTWRCTGRCRGRVAVRRERQKELKGRS